MGASFTEMVGIEFPIVAFSHCRDVVVAVSKACGLGVLGANMFTPEQLELELKWIDENIGGRPYGVDLLAPPPVTPEKEEDDLEVIEQRLPTEHKAYVDSLIERFDIPAPKTDRGHIPFGDGGLIVSRRSLQQRLEVTLEHPIKFLVSALGPFDPKVVRSSHERGIVVGGLVGSVKHALKHRGADSPEST
ncbi:nitronate monooxygenase [Amycolatopsis bartoniae]|uniref:Nitronate monooxygenase n=1 Tax=Amycolatopsis bartoniae TaxID=941986 RepID=A0A8H9MBQ6_9PSEU|nr:nitronate monooxygenase [Amycolatopsis bartoniae]GHF66514.1 hypothetical protein GCM10017566_45390 [Amycolatopsis bartoniae]